MCVGCDKVEVCILCGGCGGELRQLYSNGIDLDLLYTVYTHAIWRTQRLVYVFWFCHSV